LLTGVAWPASQVSGLLPNALYFVLSGLGAARRLWLLALSQVSLGSVRIGAPSVP
jgi:hypothetical protein